MSDSVQTTLEEASRCPRCEQPGEFAGERELKSVRNAKLKMFTCKNSRCKWFNTPWSVQVNANGTIPPALLNRPKQFRPLPNDGGRTLENLQRQLEIEKGSGGEVSRLR